MRITDFRVALLSTLAILFCSCTQQTKLVKLYEDPSADDRKYQRIFVVGIAGDANARRSLEDLISENLRDAGVVAISGHTMTGAKTILLQDEIDAAARQSDSEAILVTHIVSVDTTAEKQEGRTDLTSVCREGDPADYFLYDYEELKEPDNVRFAHTVVAVTSLYDVAEGERIWTIQSTCFEKATFDEVLIEEAEVITRQLQLDNLIG